jgi:photosystem II stability/assembly factor-like uncharacterized protein
VRRLGAFADAAWAVGDAGLVLRSDDGGATWKRLAAPNDIHFDGIAGDGQTVFLFGGRSVVGHTRGWGLGAICRTSDDGTTVEQIPAGKTGWLYGGVFAPPAALAFGQATAAAPGGIVRTVTGGKLWSPVALDSSGYLLGGAFRTLRHGYVVGGKARIVSLRNLSEPATHPPQIAAGLDLRAGAFSDDESFWAAGANGTLLRSRPAGGRWQLVQLPLPHGTRRLADFEAIAFASPQRGWLGGGLLGVLLHTDDGGARWKLLPAPPSGPIHDIAHVTGDLLLAAGAGGRIWRSTDAGKTWKRAAGTAQTDVLFVLSAGDRSLFPAIVAHALAGCDVAVVFATCPGGDGLVYPSQPLRAAAARAGAGSVTVLTDFPAAFSAMDSDDFNEDDILELWSRRVEVPAKDEMLRQLAAAIRLYRPLVLAVGPDGKGPRGRRAENRLVARLAREAAELAARRDALKPLLQAGLDAWQVKRVFVGVEANERWTAPWEEPARLDRSRLTMSFDAGRYPRGETRNLEMLAADALWRMPQVGLLDRSATRCGYVCKGQSRHVTLFTGGLTKAHLPYEPYDEDRRRLATASDIRLAVASRRTATALAGLTAAAEEAGDDPLASDRLLLLWTRLLAEGKLVHARQARDAFLRTGSRHPLFARMNVLALACETSAEWQAQRRRLAAATAPKPSLLKRAVRRYASWWEWSQTPAGRTLLAHALARTGRAPQAQEILAAMAAGPYDPWWQTHAAFQGTGRLPVTQEAYLPRTIEAAPITAPGKIDGLLDEPFWKDAPTIALAGAGERAPRSEPAAELKVVRTATHVVLAATLPRRAGRQWRLDFAFDADWDAWTQLVVHADTLGGRKASLRLRHGPTAELTKAGFPLQGTETKERCTLELAVALEELGADAPRAAAWSFQVRATALEHGRPAATHFFQPQPDRRLLPERFGILRLPAAPPPYRP